MNAVQKTLLVYDALSTAWSVKCNEDSRLVSVLDLSMFTQRNYPHCFHHNPRVRTQHISQHDTRDLFRSSHTHSL